MKFLCSNCKAKYQIPDEKIAGRTLKMDCRRCNTPITIRGDQPQEDDVESATEEEPRPRAPAPAAASRGGARSTGTGTARPLGASTSGSSVGAHPAARSSTAGRSALGADFRRNVAAGGNVTEQPRVTPLDQWHVAINDVPVGPMKRDEIARKIAAGAANAESLAWREGFDDWRPIREIPELAALLRRATQESERPPARAGASRQPAPRAPAPARGVMPSPGARSPLGAPAASARPAARSNVVPIGGRLGASAAPTFDLEDGDDVGGGEGETTTIASAADLGLGDFGKVARDDGEIPAPAARREEPKKEPIKPAGLTGGLKPIPPPAAARTAAPAPAKPAPAPVAKSAPIAKPAPSKPAPVAKPAPAPVAPAPEEDDDFGLPPPVDLPAAKSKTPSFAPPPPVAAPVAAAPVVLKASTPPPREERRAGLGVGALMGIGFAMAAGGVLMYGVVQRFVLAPPPPTTTVVATVATIATPPVTDTQVQAPVDIAPPPSSAVVATDVAPPPSSTVATTATGSHHPSGGSAPPPSATTARAGSRPAAPEDPRFAQFADDGAGPAPIATAATPHRDEAGGPAHSSAELTSDQIGSVVRSGQRALTTCWETALRQAGHVDGDVRYNIDITIGTSGRVTSVNARGTAMANLQDCLERGVRRWVFPPSGSETQTTFPLVFSAQQ